MGQNSPHIQTVHFGCSKSNQEISYAKAQKYADKSIINNADNHITSYSVQWFSGSIFTKENQNSDINTDLECLASLETLPCLQYDAGALRKAPASENVTLTHVAYLLLYQYTV